jgi:hypothetical protein
LDRDQNFAVVSEGPCPLKWMWNQYSMRRRSARARLE